MSGESQAFPSPMGDMGMTKKEYFAGVALQGLLSNPQSEFDPHKLVKAAKMISILLIEELEK